MAIRQPNTGQAGPSRIRGHSESSFDSFIECSSPVVRQPEVSETEALLHALQVQQYELKAAIDSLTRKTDAILKILGPQLHTVRYYPSRYERLGYDL